jgi:hypothetical protein
MSDEEHADCRECDGIGFFIRGAAETRCRDCDGTGRRPDVAAYVGEHRARIRYTRRAVTS